MEERHLGVENQNQNQIKSMSFTVCMKVYNEFEAILGLELRVRNFNFLELRVATKFQFCKKFKV